MTATRIALAAGAVLALFLTFGVFETYPPSRVADVRGAIADVREACADTSREVDLGDSVDVLVEALGDSPDQPIPLYGAGGVVPVRAVVAQAAAALQAPTTFDDRPGAKPAPASAPCVRSTRDDARRLSAAVAGS